MLHSVPLRIHVRNYVTLCGCMHVFLCLNVLHYVSLKYLQNKIRVTGKKEGDSASTRSVCH